MTDIFNDVEYLEIICEQMNNYSDYLRSLDQHLHLEKMFDCNQCAE